MEWRAVIDERDIACVAALARSIWREAHAEFLSDAQIEYMLDRFESPARLAEAIARGDSYWLLSVDGDAVGYCAARGVEPDGVHLSKLYVLQTHRGTGLAAAALDRLCADAVRHGARRMTLNVNKRNARALAFYAKHGFEIDGPRIVDIGGGFVMDDWTLVRRLP